MREEDVAEALTQLVGLLLRQRATSLSRIGDLLAAVDHLRPFRNPPTRRHAPAADIRKSLATTLDNWLPWDEDRLAGLGLRVGRPEREIWHNLLLGKGLEERTADGRTRSFLQGLSHEWSSLRPDLQ